MKIKVLWQSSSKKERPSADEEIYVRLRGKCILNSNWDIHDILGLRTWGESKVNERTEDRWHKRNTRRFNEIIAQHSVFPSLLLLMLGKEKVPRWPLRLVCPPSCYDSVVIVGLLQRMLGTCSKVGETKLLLLWSDRETKPGDQRDNNILLRAPIFTTIKT